MLPDGDALVRLDEISVEEFEDTDGSLVTVMSRVTVTVVILVLRLVTPLVVTSPIYRTHSFARCAWSGSY